MAAKVINSIIRKTCDLCDRKEENLTAGRCSVCQMPFYFKVEVLPITIGTDGKARANSKESARALVHVLTSQKMALDLYKHWEAKAAYDRLYAVKLSVEVTEQFEDLDNSYIIKWMTYKCTSLHNTGENDERLFDGIIFGI